MIKMLASGAWSAAALAKSRTMEALVLKRSGCLRQSRKAPHEGQFLPSRVMPGLRGTPAGMRTISAPLRASARPDGVGSYPRTLCLSADAHGRLGRKRHHTSLLVLMWPMSAATPVRHKLAQGERRQGVAGRLPGARRIS